MIPQATAAYIHIPFCRRRCYYCDFPVSVVGDHSSDKINREQAMKRYVAVLCQEISLSANWFPASGLETVFFGGGTPSLLPVDDLEKILATLDQHFGIAKDAEISIEIDPGTFDLHQLKAYQHLGINRYSLGVQSFEDELLAQLGRTHRADDIERAIAQLQQVGIDHFSLDLISGLPNQTLEQWESTLEKALSLSPRHLSCYDLIIEPGTAFERQAKTGTLPLPPDETSAQMYRLTQQRLTTADYIHYEISNYAQRGDQCRHNRTYWQNLPYYGFGMGAASFLGGKRLTRPRTRREYFSWVETLSNFNNDLILVTDHDDPNDRLLETLMLGLRLQEGVNLDAIAIKFGSEAVTKLISVLQPYRNRNWVNWNQNDAHHWGQLKLSDPEGFLFSNTILADLFRTLTDEI
jgi:oxygen-independent coproporphyrinogen-3 oxidase